MDDYECSCTYKCRGNASSHATSCWSQMHFTTTGKQPTGHIELTTSWLTLRFIQIPPGAQPGMSEAQTITASNRRLWLGISWNASGGHRLTSRLHRDSRGSDNRQEHEICCCMQRYDTIYRTPIIPIVISIPRNQGQKSYAFLFNSC